MSARDPGNPAGATAPATGAGPAPGPADGAAPYEPPAIAWEERLEALAATSCAGTNPFDQNCAARPVA